MKEDPLEPNLKGHSTTFTRNINSFCAVLHFFHCRTACSGINRNQRNTT